MAVISKPSTTFNIEAAPTPVANAPQKILYIGQQNGGTATSEVLVKDIGTSGEENALFGQKSMLAYAIREARKLNSVTRIDAIPFVDDVGGSQATAAIDFTGTATENDTVNVVVQSKTNFLFKVDVSIGDTASEVAIAVAAAINANADILVTAIPTSTVVDLTSVHTGTWNNFISLRVESLPTGITVSTLTAFSGGTGLEPTDTIFAQVSAIRYQSIVYDAKYTLSDVVDFLDARFNSTNAVLDGVAIIAATDSASNLKAQAVTLDSLSAVFLANKPISITAQYEGSAMLELDYAISSQFCAIRALRLTPNQNIANLLVGGSIFSTIGGPNRAALPYHNTPFANLPVIEEELGWTFAEQDDFNNNGVAFLGNNANVSSVIAGDIVTMYLTNTAAVSDKTFKFLNAVDTSSAVREFFFNNNKEQYAQAVLTSGDPIANANMVTVLSITGFQTALFTDLALLPFALTPKGDVAVKFFEDNLSVTADFESGTITIIAEVPIVSQVRIINGTLRIAFTVQTGG